MTKGQRIKKKREELRVSQTDLANAIGISKQTLYKYENDIVANIPSEVIERLSFQLDCSPGYIMGWENSEGLKDCNPKNVVGTKKGVLMKYLVTSSRLREALEESHMTQQQLADKSKVAKASISHYVNGLNEPGNKSAYMMAKVLGVSPAWLMGFDVPKIPQTDPETEMNDIEKAKELYEKYLHAIPEIRSAIDSLLKPKSDP